MRTDDRPGRDERETPGTLSSCLDQPGTTEEGPDLASILSGFDGPGAFLSGARFGTGHLNETYLVHCEGGRAPGRFVLQRLNTGIFRDPVAVMENIVQVTRHLRRRLATACPGQEERRVLTLIHRKGGPESYLNDPVLGFWRCMIHIDGARTHDVLESPSQAYAAARGFGGFQRLLGDYDGPRLVETISRFHDTRVRLEHLRQAVASDPLGRAAETSREIDFAFEREELADSLLRLQASGEIPERITHNDTKLNNVMLDDATGEGICVMDLDTVMPGLSLYDFGDMVRSACNSAAEDERDLSRIAAREDVFEALARGYLEGSDGILLPVERQSMALAGRLLTYECGVRFLTDHLEGDGYFRIHRPGHNLDRARNQFALLRSLEQKDAVLQRIIQGLPAASRSAAGRP